MKISSVYLKPVVLRVGSFEEITQAKGGGSHFDSTFVVNKGDDVAKIIAAHTS